MTINTSPVFPGTPKTATITHASGALTNPGTDTPTGTTLLCTIGTAGAQGGRLSMLPLATNTATTVMLFRRKSTDGASVRRLIDAKLLTVQTVSSSSPPAAVDFTRVAAMDFDGGDELHVGTYAAAGVPIVFDFQYYDLTKPA